MGTKRMRANPALIVGVIALVFALTGAAAALPGKNKVDSNDIKRGAVRSKAIKDGAVTEAKLGAGAVTGAKLAGGAVDAAKLADGSVGSAKLADGSVGSAKLADGSVSSPKLADRSVGSAKLADGSVGTAKLGDGAVTGAKVADGSLTGAKIEDGSLRASEIGAVSGTFILDADPIAANDCNLETPNVPGIQLGDIVVVAPPNGLLDVSDKFSITSGQAGVPGFPRLKFCNPTAAAQDPPSATFRFVAIRP